MRFAVDAHSIGRHQTGNEVYVRNLLNAFAAQERSCEFVAYISADAAREIVPARFRTRRIIHSVYISVTIASFTRVHAPRKYHNQLFLFIFMSVQILIAGRNSFMENLLRLADTVPNPLLS